MAGATGWRGAPEQWQGVIEHVMDAGAWRPAFRLVCRQWRQVFDTRVPHDALPLSRWLTGDVLERAVADGAHTRCRWRVRFFYPSITTLPRRLLELIGCVHALDLTGCTGITNVSALGGVHTLNLSHRTGIIDVSALGGVHTLNLFGCTGITDVSALGGVHTLFLYGCTGITDVSALGGVHTLYLDGCTGITDVSALGGVHTLNLSYCTGITDVSALGGVTLID